jgi:ribosomal protein S18 acetylase RimI-like enzyme
MIALRPETPQDVPFLRRLYATTREQEMRALPWDAQRREAFLDMQFAAQASHYRACYPDCEFQVIERAGKPAGRLYVERLEDEIRIVDIALAPEHCGRGIGGELLRALLGEAREGGKTVSIYVETFNPARRLYDRLGFRALDTNGVYLRMEWTPEPESVT